MHIPLSWYLILAAALFCIGLFGVLSRRNAIAILLGIELMLNAVNINLVAFWRYLDPAKMAGQVFADRRLRRGSSRGGSRFGADHLGVSPSQHDRRGRDRFDEMVKLKDKT